MGGDKCTCFTHKWSCGVIYPPLFKDMSRKLKGSSEAWRVAYKPDAFAVLSCGFGRCGPAPAQLLNPISRILKHGDVLERGGQQQQRTMHHSLLRTTWKKCLCIPEVGALHSDLE